MSLQIAKVNKFVEARTLNQFLILLQNTEQQKYFSPRETEIFCLKKAYEFKRLNSISNINTAFDSSFQIVLCLF